MGQRQSNNSPGVNSTLEDASTSDDDIERMAAKLLGQDLFRQRTNQIIVEHTGTVDFMKKVQEYADTQIDTRLFKNAKVMLTVIIGWIATGVIAFIVAKLTH